MPTHEPGPTPPALEARDITKSFGEIRANRKVDIDVMPGEIHGILGENGAGKTTLMNILYGLIQPDSGSILLRGREVTITSPKRAISLGIGMVHQHFMLVPNLTVAENIVLACSIDGRLWRGVAARANDIRELCARYGLDVDPLARVDSLSLGQQQRIEILKLLYSGAQILIFDEPTAVLTPPEWQDLKRMMRQYASEQKSIIFITHKVEEMYEVASRCTVMRDGSVVGTRTLPDANRSELARMMVGREIELRGERVSVDRGEPVLEVRDVSHVDDDGVARLSGISFSVNAGEIFGIAGVDGNGQRELVEVLVGVRTTTSGEIRIAPDHELVDHGPGEFFVAGGAVIHDDRSRAGLALELTIQDNLLTRAHAEPTFSRYGIMNTAQARRFSENLVTEYRIRVPGVDARVAQLSGGNQQRVVLARELQTVPRLIVAAQPTRGLDIAAVEAVYHHLRSHQARGAAILLISTELEELLTLADRIAVLSRGRFTGIVDPESVDLEQLGMLIATEAPATGASVAGPNAVRM